jgi:trehalose/maltose transport system substrate-binding protein
LSFFFPSTRGAAAAAARGPEVRRAAWPAAISVLALLSVCPTAAPTAELTIVCGLQGIDHPHCRQAAETWAQARGHQVRVLPAPDDLPTRLRLYQELLEVGAPKPDVLEIDVVSPSLLAHHLLDLGPRIGAAAADYLPALIAADTVAGRLVALPYSLNFGLLFYRRDLLARSAMPVPDTWDALERAAAVVQDQERNAGNARFWGFLWQGARAEILTCNALEWIASWGGGTIVAAAGGVTIDNPAALFALQRASNWGGIISPASPREDTERDSVAQFAAGNAAFVRAWPGAWRRLNAADSPVRGKVGVAPLPKGGTDGIHAATLAGWQLAVSRSSAHPDLAAELVLYLTGEDAQRRRALELGLTPTRTALLTDPQIEAAQPYLRALSAGELTLVARPAVVTGRRYLQVSGLVQSAVASVLGGQVTAAQALKTLEHSLNVISRQGEDW